jgi:glyoxylase-like metal-dependent hydrolase (beta-lactamase superfamily II)
VSAREVAPGITALGGRKGGRVHAFLVAEDDGLTLIDTMYETDGSRVRAALAGLGRSVADIRRIVLTHAHRSHLGGAAALRDASGAPVLAHAWEADIVRGERKAQPAGFRPTRPLRVWAPMYPYQVALGLGVGAHPRCPVDESLRGGERLGSLEVLPAGGHSPGHLGFWHAEHRVLIAGDAVSTWPAFGPGWPSINLNERQHRETLERFASLRPDIVCVGHGAPITRGAADALDALVAEPRAPRYSGDGVMP